MDVGVKVSQSPSSSEPGSLLNASLRTAAPTPLALVEGPAEDVAPSPQAALESQASFPLTSWLCWSTHCGPGAKEAQSNKGVDTGEEGYSVLTGHVLSTCCIQGM